MSLLAHNLAQFHSMKVPIKNNFINDNWLFKNFDEFYEDAIKKFGFNEFTTDLNNEIIWMKNVISDLDSPIVFCHNDLHGGNILIRENYDQQENKLLFCDFDWSAYGYRGLDFGNFFAELNETEESSHEIIELFLKNYINEYVKNNGVCEDKRNQIEYLVKETKVFMLFSHLYTVLIRIIRNDFRQLDTKSLMVRQLQKFFN